MPHVAFVAVIHLLPQGGITAPGLAARYLFSLLAVHRTSLENHLRLWPRCFRSSFWMVFYIIEAAAILAILREYPDDKQAVSYTSSA